MSLSLWAQHIYNFVEWGMALWWGLEYVMLIPIMLLVAYSLWKEVSRRSFVIAMMVILLLLNFHVARVFVIALFIIICGVIFVGKNIWGMYFD